MTLRLGQPAKASDNLGSLFCEEFLPQFRIFVLVSHSFLASDDAFVSIVPCYVLAQQEKVKSYKPSASKVNDEFEKDTAKEADDKLDQAIRASERQTPVLKETKERTTDIKKRIEERYRIDFGIVHLIRTGSKSCDFSIRTGAKLNSNRCEIPRFSSKFEPIRN